MAVTLSPDNFKIDDEGNVRIDIAKAVELLQLLQSLQANAKTSPNTIPPNPVVKVEM
jgi:hypothetical protein